jgi:large conductance mechanosensitive channel
MLHQFKDFLLKSNVIDLAVAVIIGEAFARIISSVVEDIITPILLTPALKAARIEDINELTWGMIHYGTFLAAVIKFLIIGYVLFVVVKLINNLRNEFQNEISPTKRRRI